MCVFECAALPSRFFITSANVAGAVPPLWLIGIAPYDLLFFREDGIAESYEVSRLLGSGASTRGDLSSNLGVLFFLLNTFMKKLPRRSPSAGDESLTRWSVSPRSDFEESLLADVRKGGGPEEADVAPSGVSAVGYSQAVFPDSSSATEIRKSTTCQIFVATQPTRLCLDSL